MYPSELYHTLKESYRGNTLDIPEIKSWIC